MSFSLCHVLNIFDIEHKPGLNRWLFSSWGFSYPPHALNITIPPRHDVRIDISMAP